MATPSFPHLAKLRVRLPIRSHDYTVYPGSRETQRDYVVGFPLELHPFAWDYVHVWSHASKLTLQPHYKESTWDSFHVENTGHVTCSAFGGAFPFTLGRQPKLLEGLRATVRALPERVESRNPDVAKTLVEIADVLDAIALHLETLPPEQLHAETQAARARHRETARGRAAERLWKRKHGGLLKSS